MTIHVDDSGRDVDDTLCDDDVVVADAVRATRERRVRRWGKGACVRLVWCWSVGFRLVMFCCC